jgi:hypothetical protein
MRRSGGHKTERQRANCKDKSLHYPTPFVALFAMPPRETGQFMGFSTGAPRRPAHHGGILYKRDLLATCRLFADLDRLPEHPLLAQLTYGHTSGDAPVEGKS